jgi:hypothetical protein
VSVSAVRVPLVDVRTYSDSPGPDNAIDLLARLPLQSTVFAFTTTSYLLGAKGEQALTARLEQRSSSHDRACGPASSALLDDYPNSIDVGNTSKFGLDVAMAV